MIRASEIAELNSDLANSGTWIQRTAEHYQGFWMYDWYMWCRRNNQGDIDAARAGIRQWQSDSLAKKDESYLRAAAIFELMEGCDADAMTKFEEAFKAVPSERTGMEAALCALSLKREKQSIDWLTKMAGTDQWGSQIAKRLLDASSRPDGLPDQAAIDKELKDLSDGSLGDAVLNYIVGRYYEIRGRADLAQAYYTASISNSDVTLSEGTLASIGLRAQGLDPMKIRCDALAKRAAELQNAGMVKHQAPSAPR